MKSCPTCRRLFPDEAGFCPVDGVELLTATEVPPEPSDDDPRIGTILAKRYQVRRVVADGGMGRVYEALDLVGNRRVALKVLHPEVSNDKVALARFKREYEISKLLPHDHIVEVFDFVTLPDGGYAIAMDFLEGEELRSVLKREKTLPPGRLIRMTSQIALGLDNAHQRNLVHRDLKPDNIFLCGTPEGDIVKLLDFGSVKDKSKGAKRLTVMGTTIGSPFYMSPEQAQGKESLDARADVWAMTAIIYECTVGQVPFTGANGPSILLAIITNDPVPPSIALDEDTARAVPLALDDVINAGLSKDPEDRITSMGELANQLGYAYGLEGDFRQWAEMPQAELERLAQDGIAKQASQAQAQVTADPFASEPQQDGPALADATENDAASPLPETSTPKWVWILIPVVIVSLVAAIAIVLFFVHS